MCALVTGVQTCALPIWAASIAAMTINVSAMTRLDRRSNMRLRASHAARSRARPVAPFRQGAALVPKREIGGYRAAFPFPPRAHWLFAGNGKQRKYGDRRGRGRGRNGSVADADARARRGRWLAGDAES